MAVSAPERSTRLLDARATGAVETAARLLAAGGLVAFPTETVYGLGARADDDEAVARIFTTKGRPADHPLIVHVLEPADVAVFAAEVPAVAERLIARCWPGPLTVILPRRDGVARGAAAGQPTIGLRSPSHPVARALLAAARAAGVPGVAGPSANRFGRVSPTRAAHVLDEFDGAVPVLDGGDCEVGIESAIVDCSRGRAVLLRPGVLTRAELEAAAGEPLHAPDASAPKASGTLEAHYAPRARVRLMAAPMLRTALQVLVPDGRSAGPGRWPAIYWRTVAPGPGLTGRAMPATPAGVAHALFADLRELDALGVDLIWVEAPPDDPSWDGVRDRLQRAAAAA